MLSVANKTFMLSFVVLNVVMLSVIMPSVVAPAESRVSMTYVYGKNREGEKKFRI